MKGKTHLAIGIFVVTLLAAAIAYFTALPAFNLTHLSPGDADETVWEINYIRTHIPVRIIQPEWVISKPDPFLNWMLAESIARLTVTGFLWLAGVFLLLRYSKHEVSPMDKQSSIM